MPPRTAIRLVPALSIAALKAKLDKELPLWYGRRTINHRGSGRLELHSAVEGLRRSFGYSKAAASADYDKPCGFSLRTDGPIDVKTSSRSLH